ncbi:MAG: aspartate--tRNA ligase [Spirochaetaceae bacterium]|nr:aspartate--tRNA ligase [Spirochaetaceae bacterium]
MHEMKRTATCGELDAAAAGGRVTLNGWVARIRDHGGIIFLDLRDRYGVTQVVFDVSADPDGGLADAVGDVKLECCVAVRGIVRRRPPDMVNAELATGAIEVAGEQLAVLSTCDTLPFMVSDQPGAHTEAREELRLKHRYLDLRSATMQRNLALRHRASQAMRAALNSRRFLEIETPTLMRSTPEGARDFVVPSRLKPGSFYALPQSPQILKQLLMLSGCDRYYQLARCYRDEDARGDRQPEFTQLDFEMSFVDQDDVLAVLEAAFAAAFRDGIGYELPLPFPRITFHDAMNRYGSDRPDLRYELELHDFTELARAGEFGIFRKAAERGDTVKALRAPGLAGYSRRQIEELEEHAKTYGAAGLAWMKCGTGGLEGGVSRFYQAQQSAILRALGAEAGDLLLLVAAPWRTACTALGAVRTELARREGLAEHGAFRPCFVTDFPLFAWNQDEQRWDAEHHMFSNPQAQYLASLEQDPAAVRGELYDAVINGVELASGSIRIHDPALQRRIFAILGVSEEEAAQRFGFMLDAFRYAPPPHGGAAIGFDRTVMLMAGEATIRDVIAFPKNTWAASPMDDSPAPLDAHQLAELALQLRQPAGG